MAGYFTVLAVTDNTDEHNVKNDIVYKTVGSYKSSIEFYGQLYEKLDGAGADPFDPAIKKKIFAGGCDIYALIVDPDIFHLCRELHEKGAYDATDLMLRKTSAKIEVTDFVKGIIEEKWPMKKKK